MFVNEKLNSGTHQAEGQEAPSNVESATAAELHSSGEDWDPKKRTPSESSSDFEDASTSKRIRLSRGARKFPVTNEQGERRYKSGREMQKLVNSAIECPPMSRGVLLAMSLPGMVSKCVDKYFSLPQSVVIRRDYLLKIISGRAIRTKRQREVLRKSVPKAKKSRKSSK